MKKKRAWESLSVSALGGISRAWFFGASPEWPRKWTLCSRLKINLKFLNTRFWKNIGFENSEFFSTPLGLTPAIDLVNWLNSFPAKSFKSSILKWDILGGVKSKPFWNPSKNVLMSRFRSKVGVKISIRVRMGGKKVPSPKRQFAQVLNSAGKSNDPRMISSGKSLQMWKFWNWAEGAF